MHLKPTFVLFFLKHRNLQCSSLYCQMRDHTVPSSAVPLSWKGALRQTLHVRFWRVWLHILCSHDSSLLLKKNIVVVSACVLSGCAFMSVCPLRIAVLKEGLSSVFPFYTESCLLRFIDWNCDFSELNTLAGTGSDVAVMLDLFWSHRFLNVWWSVYSLFKLWGADVMASSKQKPGHTVAQGFGLSLWPRHTSFFSSSEISFKHDPPPPSFFRSLLERWYHSQWLRISRTPLQWAAS